MKCLHGVPAAQSVTQNGSFWFCNQNPSCHFVCSADECDLFERAISAWRMTNQPHPRCMGHNKIAKMWVVKDLMKVNYGRPFFTCSEKTKHCSFWIWGDMRPQVRPNCSHEVPCAIRKVKKEGMNKDRKFLCCSKNRESSCGYFEWVPEEPDQDIPYPVSNKPNKEPRVELAKEFMNDFVNSWDI